MGVGGVLPKAEKKIVMMVQFPHSALRISVAFIIHINNLNLSIFFLGKAHVTSSIYRTPSRRSLNMQNCLSLS